MCGWVGGVSAPVNSTQALQSLSKVNLEEAPPRVIFQLRRDFTLSSTASLEQMEGPVLSAETEEGRVEAVHYKFTNQPSGRDCLVTVKRRPDTDYVESVEIELG